MESLVKDIPGYLGTDHAQTPGGLGITVGYFRDAEALDEWRSNAEHRTAQKRGRAEWYQSYTLHVAKVRGAARITRREVSGNGRQPPDLRRTVRVRHRR
ncbi:antibiotic biosynthesis monooxygenase family protein [Streptomyces nigra]|uniref:antibiotic biosynthesis monooxygenase family protein n=1 Tax=Streptomyces nigra TaxID=1827580 RepID=UPI0034481A14